MCLHSATSQDPESTGNSSRSDRAARAGGGSAAYSEPGWAPTPRVSAASAGRMPPSHPKSLPEGARPYSSQLRG
eukprot:12266769-Alexandrium_andersonii.AAC.1